MTSLPWPLPKRDIWLWPPTRVTFACSTAWVSTRRHIFLHWENRSLVWMCLLMAAGFWPLAALTFCWSTTCKRRAKMRVSLALSELSPRILSLNLVGWVCNLRTSPSSSTKQRSRFPSLQLDSTPVLIRKRLRSSRLPVPSSSPGV